jgi:predicted acyl esterase
VVTTSWSRPIGRYHAGDLPRTPCGADEHLLYPVLRPRPWTSARVLRDVDVVAHANDIAVPLLHIGGWYDNFLRGHLDLNEALKSHPGRTGPR